MSRYELNIATGKRIELTDEPSNYMPPTIEELRQTMVVSAAQVRLNLKSAGYLNTITAKISALPEDDEMRILWEYSAELHRLNPTIVDFCTNTLGLNDIQIDGLFT